MTTMIAKNEYEFKTLKKLNTQLYEPHDSQYIHNIYELSQAEIANLSVKYEP